MYGILITKTLPGSRALVAKARVVEESMPPERAMTTFSWSVDLRIFLKKDWIFLASAAGRILGRRDILEILGKIKSTSVE